MTEHAIISLAPTIIVALRRAAFAIGILAVCLSLVGFRYGWLDYRPGGAAFDVDVRPIFTGLFVVSLLLALKWEIAGGAMAGFAGAALIAFAARQLVVSHAILVVALLLVPAVLWLIVDLADLPPRQAIIGVAITVALSGVGLFVGDRVYEYLWGPTHPESIVVERPESLIEWVWSGAVTSREAEVRSLPASDHQQARLALSTDSGLRAARFVDAREDGGRVIGFELDGLEPDTQYFYAVEIDGELDMVRSGTFRTFPAGPASFTVAIGACARVGSNGQVFDTIRELNPLFYLITGDLHYGDNGRNDIDRYREVMDLTLSMPAQAALYEALPVAYMWDACGTITTTAPMMPTATPPVGKQRWRRTANTSQVTPCRATRVPSTRRSPLGGFGSSSPMRDQHAILTTTTTPMRRACSARSRRCG